MSSNAIVVLSLGLVLLAPTPSTGEPLGRCSDQNDILPLWLPDVGRCDPVLRSGLGARGCGNPIISALCPETCETCSEWCADQESKLPFIRMFDPSIPETCNAAAEWPDPLYQVVCGASSDKCADMTCGSDLECGPDKSCIAGVCDAAQLRDHDEVAMFFSGGSTCDETPGEACGSELVRYVCPQRCGASEYSASDYLKDQSGIFRNQFGASCDEVDATSDCADDLGVALLCPQTCSGAPSTTYGHFGDDLGAYLRDIEFRLLFLEVETDAPLKELFFRTDVLNGTVTGFANHMNVMSKHMQDMGEYFSMADEQLNQQLQQQQAAIEALETGAATVDVGGLREDLGDLRNQVTALQTANSNRTHSIIDY